MRLRTADFIYFVILAAVYFSNSCNEVLGACVAVAFGTVLIPRKARPFYFLSSILLAVFLEFHFCLPLKYRRPIESLRLESVSTALEWYKADHGCLPPRFTRDKTGRAGLSWRVLILPYLGHTELFERFDLSEAWDSKRNLMASRAIPSEYRINDRHSKSSHATDVVVVYGPSCLWLEREPFHPNEIADSSDITIQLILIPSEEIQNWTAPFDISESEFLSLVDEKIDLGFVWTAFADGRVRKLANRIGLHNWVRGLEVSNGGMNMLEVEKADSEADEKLRQIEFPLTFLDFIPSRRAVLILVTIMVFLADVTCARAALYKGTTSSASEHE